MSAKKIGEGNSKDKDFLCAACHATSSSCFRNINYSMFISIFLCVLCWKRRKCVRPYFQNVEIDVWNGIVSSSQTT